MTIRTNYRQIQLCIHNKEFLIVQVKKDSNELLGRTESDEMIIIKGKKNKIGELIISKIIDLRGSTFIGKEI